MITLTRGGALLASLLLLAACAQSGGNGGAEVELGSGSRCLTAPDPAKCRMAHERAGIHLQQVHPGGR